jgi:hypothetical protein
MQSRVWWAAAVGILAAGCTAILGDFTVEPSSSSTTSGDGGGDTDASIDGPVGPTDGPHAMTCAFIPTSFRKVTDLKAHDAGDNRYDGLAVVSINDSAIRIMPRFSGPSGDTLMVYTLRTDKPQDTPNMTMVPSARPSDMHHRMAPNGAGEIDILTSFGSNNWAVYALPDNNEGAQLQNPTTLLSTSLPNGSQSRAVMLPLGPQDYFGLAEYQDTPTTFNVGTARATGGPGTFFTSAASGTTPMSTDFLNLVRIGDDVYGFNVGDVSAGGAMIQWKWPVTPAAGSGEFREGVGNGLIPIATYPSVGGTGIDVVLGKLGFDSSGMTIVSLEMAAGTIPNANFFSFTYGDLKKVSTTSDPDLFTFGPKSAGAGYPGHLAFLGRGSLTTSTGLNFSIVDIAAGTLAYSASGTGKNLLQGNVTIDAIAMDYFAAQFGGSFGFNVVWTEHVYEDGGSDYDAMFYQKLQCDP